jgi:hypothetical protein
MRTFTNATLALAIAASAALAAPLGEKEIDDLAKECEKAASQGKDAEAIAKVAAIAAGNTAAGTRALLDLAVRVEGGRVYREIVTALAKTGGGEGLEVLLSEGRTTTSRERRLVIADAIAEDPTAKEALIPGFLLDKDDVLARLMIEVVSQRMLKVGMEPLIATLERHESGEARRPEIARLARKALIRLAGKEFESARDWRNWWEPRKEKWDPYDPGDGDGGAGATAAREEPKFFGTEVTSSHVSIVIDISGSMAQAIFTGAKIDPSCKGHNFPKKDNCPACNWHPKGGDIPEEPPPHKHAVPPCTCKGGQEKRIDRAREEILGLIKSLPEETMFNVIAFNSQVQRWQRAVTRATKDAKANACAWVKKLKESGFTETGKALDAAFEDPAVDTIYLVSDGAPERSAKEKIPTEPILRSVEKKNRFRKVKIVALGWGTIDEDFMRRLAEENGGTFEHIVGN